MNLQQVEQEAVVSERLSELESVIEHGLKTYVEVGKALDEIREGKLYRQQGFGTFEEYCEKRWGWTRQHGYLVIRAAAAAENVISILHSAPSMAQAAILATLTPDQQRELAAKADFGTVTVQEVKQMVQAIRNPAPAETVPAPARSPEQPAPAPAAIQPATQLHPRPWEPTPESGVVRCEVCCNLHDGSVQACPYCTKAADERIADLTTAKQNRLAPLMSSDSEEWYTPPEIVVRVLKIFGSIDLDPCSNTIGNPNIPAVHRFTQADDGLAKSWFGKVYMNPPYGREIPGWIKKLDAEFRTGEIKEAIALVPARVDTDWFRVMRDYAVCFVDGRLKFSGHENSAPFPSAVIYLGRNIDDFYDAFSDMGDVWVRWTK